MLNYQSQVLFDPDLAIEMLVFDRPVKREALEETARAVLGSEEGIGEVVSEDDERA